MADFQKIREELEWLRSQSKDGKLTAEDIYRYGCEFESEIGNYFTEKGVFDAEVAQQKYGELLARQLIVRCRIFVQHPTEEKVVRVRQFVSLPSDRITGGGYRPIADVMAKTDLRAELLASALKDLQALRARYANLMELQDVFNAIDAASKSLEAAKEDAAQASV